MTIENGTQENVSDLPHALRTAQAAVHLPEVQAMLRRLSEYGLGIFMPHMHDERTGAFRPLPDEVTQVEAGLEVTFRPAADVTGQWARFLPVGWCWRSGAATPAAVCEMAPSGGPGDAEGYDPHKMKPANEAG